MTFGYRDQQRSHKVVCHLFINVHVENSRISSVKIVLKKLLKLDMWKTF